MRENPTSIMIEETIYTQSELQKMSLSDLKFLCGAVDSENRLRKMIRLCDNYAFEAYVYNLISKL